MTHREYQEAVAKVLEHYGFITRPEFWNSAGRLDVFGRCARRELCGEATVAVEVSRTSRLESDISRVYRSGATYGFVLAVKPVELPPVRWGNVFVVRSLEEFESRLREVLGVAGEQPLLTPELVRGVQPPRYADLDEVFERFGVPEELRVRARRLLLHARTTYYHLYVDDERSPTGYRVVGDEVAYHILHQLGIADLERRSRWRTYWVRVLDEKLAAIEAEKHVDRVEENLRNLIDEYGWEVAFIAACSGGGLPEQGRPEPMLLVCEGLPRRVTAAIGALKPVLWEGYRAFRSQLMRLDLAFCETVPLRLCRMLPEAERALLKLVNDSVVEFSKNEELVKELATLNVLYNLFPLSAENYSTLLSTLSELELRLEDLEKASQEFHRLGLVSRFVKDRPPYLVVYDKARFREAIVEKIASLRQR